MKFLIKTSLILIVFVLVSCTSGLNENYSSSIYENEQKPKLLEDGIDSLTIKMIDFEILHNDELDGKKLKEIAEMGALRHSNIISDLEKEFQVAKNNNESKSTLIKILSEIEKYDQDNQTISTGLEYIESLKFSTINEILLGSKITEIGGVKKSENDNSIYEVFTLPKVTINTLEGELVLYVKNNKIEKIEFVSTDSWMGATNVSSYVLKKFYDSRVSWIQNAMTYYDIPEWKDDSDMAYFEKNGIVHQYILKQNQFLGVKIGWSLNYIITSKTAIDYEINTKNSGLNF
ncbi:hypothetical protein [Oceanihabitans sediminis]|uniref:hypothetical protein n=1 Tax=Oceanihabitans sediminis TaxID=1812012 RepID=UPI003A8E7306